MYTSGSKDVLLDNTGLFRDGSIKKRNYLFRYPVYDICLVSQHNAYAIQSKGKKIVNIPILTQDVCYDKYFICFSGKKFVQMQNHLYQYL